MESLQLTQGSPVANPVQSPTSRTRHVASFLECIDEPISDLARIEIAVAVADALHSLSGRPDRPRVRIDIRAVELVRDYLTAHAREQTPASILEKIVGTDRFTIARHFRWAFGTSPDRYRTMRRLAWARTAIESGLSLARAATDAGFADQSHMTRQFKKTYGLTPGHWAAAVATAAFPGEWLGQRATRRSGARPTPPERPRVAYRKSARGGVNTSIV